MPVRKCQTCKYYEPSPIRRRGWCRNPLLYSPQQSHLVGQDDLDCGRGIGSYWEPAESTVPSNSGAKKERSASIFQLFAKGPQFAPAGAPVVGGMMASSTSGGGSRPPSSSGSTSNQPPRDRGGSGESGGGSTPPSGSGRPQRPTTPTGQERYVSYQREEERYWTDYLRIALPVIGLLLLLGLFWYWANALINNDSGNGGSAGAAATQTAAAAIVIQTAPVPTATVAAPATIAATETNLVEPEASETVTATQTTNSNQGQQTAQNQPTTSSQQSSTNNNAASTNDAFQQGEHVVVTDNQVNVRSSPSATDSSNIIGQVNTGDELTIIGPAEESGGYTWWPVQIVNTGDDGYIVEEFIRKEGS